MVREAVSFRAIAESATLQLTSFRRSRADGRLRFRAWLGVVAGAGNVDDDLDRGVGILLGIKLAFDGGAGTEVMIGDIGEVGGAVGGRFSFCESMRADPLA